MPVPVPFFPVLLWFVRASPADFEKWLPIVIFFVVHALYVDWRGGTGFSARYLVPAVPILFYAGRSVPRLTPMFRVAAVYSIVWGMLAGFSPALVFDRSPLGVVNHIWARL